MSDYTIDASLRRAILATVREARFEQLRRALGRTPTAEELAADMKHAPDIVDEAMRRERAESPAAKFWSSDKVSEAPDPKAVNEALDELWKAANRGDLW